MTAKPNTASRKSRSRGARSDKKPVTIELEAEKVKSTKGKASPKSEPKSGAATASKTTPKQPASKGSTSASVGRDAKSAPSETPKTNGGPFGMLAAGVLGGLIALGGGYALQYVGLLPSPGTQNAETVTSDTLAASTSDLNAKIAALEAKISESTPAPSIDPTALETAIDARLAALPKSEPDTAPSDELVGKLAENDAKIADLQTLLDKTSGTLASLQSSLSSGEAGDAAALAALKTRMDSLSGDLTGLRDTVSGLSGGAMVSDITAMGTTLGAISDRLGKMETGFSETQTRIENLPTNVADGAKLATLADSLTGMKSSVDSVQQSISNQQDKLTTLQTRMENGADKKAARALAAAALKSDIDRGVPFSESLTVLQSVAGDATDLTALEAHANSGIPSTSALADRLDAVGAAIIAATTEVKQDDPLSRLVAGAKSFVKVKTLAPKEGNTPSAIVSRIRAATTSGDLQDAAKEWASLPPAGQAASADWHNDLQARLVANSLMTDTVKTFMSATSQPSGTGN